MLEISNGAISWKPLIQGSSKPQEAIINLVSNLYFILEDF